MDLGTIANVATAAAVVTGVIFGIVEVAHARLERRERAAMEVLHAMMTPEYMRSVAVIHELPVGADIVPQRLVVMGFHVDDILLRVLCITRRTTIVVDLRALDHVAISILEFVVGQVAGQTDADLVSVQQ